MPTKPRNTATITFSLPPEMAQELREVVKEEDRTVSELLREAIRLYMEEREWRIRERGTIAEAAVPLGCRHCLLWANVRRRVPPEKNRIEQGEDTDERSTRSDTCGPLR